MKETIEIITVLVLALFFWTPTLLAADPMWEYIYEGDILPDDASLGNDAWQLMGDNISANITDQGELHIYDVGANHCFFLYDIPDAALMQQATVEARVKVLSKSGSANFEVLVGMQDGSNSKWLDLFPDRILLDNTEHTVAVDMAEYHILRMVRNEGDIHIYVDDELVISESHVGAGESWTGFIFGAGCTSCTSDQYWDYLVFTTEGGFSPDELPSYASLLETELADDPAPVDGANDVPRDVSLSWVPGEFAAKHDVYRGALFEDVNTAAPGTLISQGQVDTNYTPETVFEFGQTYYWRVDEVNGAPDNTVYKGNVWSFTVEPMGIPITAITATASGANPGMEASNTIDGSGLNELDQHSAIPTDMWLTATNGSWIQYEFDKAYKLHELLIWNSNQAIESFIGFGIKEAIIETSFDAMTWTQVKGVPQFDQASGLTTYQAKPPIDLKGMVAKYVKITPQSTHGLTGQAGLSEVRFLHIPTAARAPHPADGTTTKHVDVTLGWRKGREALTHEVQFSTDRDAVVNGEAQVASVDGTEYVVDSLRYDTPYYWQIIEVNETEVPAAYASDIWSFTTSPHGIVDDFESYSGEQGNEVFSTWLDGYGGDASLGGSTTGHIDGPFVETAIVNPGTGGKQSMPLFYDNDGNFSNVDSAMSSPSFSEVLREYDVPQDWTASGIVTLSIIFSGTAGATGQLYCKIGNAKVLYHGDPANLGATAWQAWTIDLSTVSGDLTSVRSLTIGVEGGGASVIYIDDIRLYP